MNKEIYIFLSILVVGWLGVSTYLILVHGWAFFFILLIFNVLLIPFYV